MSFPQQQSEKRQTLAGMITAAKPGEQIILYPTSKTGNKDDNGKSRVDLLDPDFLLAVGEVLKFGAEKPSYGAHNWRNGINTSRLIAGALRHLFAIMRGEDRDPESGLSHCAHLGCAVMFLYWTLKHKPEFDDRYTY